MTILFAGRQQQPNNPPPSPYVPSIIGIRQTWTVGDVVFALTDPNSPVRLKKGVRGLSSIDPVPYLTKSPSVPGSRWRGRSYDERSVFWPVAIAVAGEQEWLAVDAAFFATLNPLSTGVWEVTTPAGVSRRLTLRFRSDGGAAYDVTPSTIGWASYGITLAAESPFWQGDPIVLSWDNDSAMISTFPAAGADYVLNLSSGRTLASAAVTNPGDVESFPAWTAFGPFTAVTLGVDGRVIEVPFALSDGQSVTVDTDPAVFSATREDGTDVTDQLGETDWAPVPPGSQVPLSLAMTGTGSVSLSPAHELPEGLVSPLRIVVLDKDLFKAGEVGDPASFTATPTFNAAGTLVFAVRTDHPRIPALLAEGAAVICYYTGLTPPLISGPVKLIAGTLADRTMTFTVNDVFGVLANILGWPVPGADLTAQTVAYDVRTGPAETVAKGVIGDNARRLGLPLTVATDQGRGGTVTGQWRFQPITDVLLDLLTTGNLGLSVQLAAPVPQADGRLASPGVTVDCYTPRAYPRLLSDVGGQVQDWSFQGAAPLATRWVLGSSQVTDGQPDTRSFLGSIDTATEDLWGPLNLVEVFLDQATIQDAVKSAQQASDDAVTALAAAQATEAASPSAENAQAVTDAQTAVTTTAAALVQATTDATNAVTAAFAKAQSDGQAVSGITATLVETKTVRYGDGLKVGDSVRIKIGPKTVTDVLKECTVTWDSTNGLLVVPVVGDLVTPTRRFVSIVAGLARTARNLAVRL